MAKPKCNLCGKSFKKKELKIEVTTSMSNGIEVVVSRTLVHSDCYESQWSKWAELGMRMPTLTEILSSMKVGSGLSPKEDELGSDEETPRSVLTDIAMLGKIIDHVDSYEDANTLAEWRAKLGALIEEARPFKL